MALFSNLSLTTAGSNLLSKVEAGGTLQFNRVALGDGEWPGSAFDPSMTALLSERIDMGIQTVVALGAGRCRLVGVCLHSDLAASGFYDRELGVFAEDPDDGEILFAAAYSGAEADWIPASASVPAYEQVFSMTLAMGAATSLTIEVGASVSLVAASEFTNHLEDTSPHGATSEATPERIVIRNDAGQFEVSAPTEDSHVVRKQDYDGHASAYDAHGAVSSATANRIIRRDGNGRAQVAAPSAANDIARLAEVTAEATARALADSQHAALTAPHNATASVVANRLALRNSLGKLLAAYGLSGNELVAFGQFSYWLPSSGKAFYQCLPTGLIFQGFQTTLADGNSECYANYPLAFPTICYIALGIQFTGNGDIDNVVKAYDQYQVTFDNVQTGKTMLCLAFGK